MQVKVGSDEFRQTVAIKIFDKASIMAKHQGGGGVGPAVGTPAGAAAAAAVAGGANGAAAAAAAAAQVPNIYQSHQLAQIEKELNALRQCSHPNIVQFYDVLETESKVYLVMEHLPYGELYDYILRKGRLDETEAKRLFRQIVEAIQHMHQKGIVHRQCRQHQTMHDAVHNDGYAVAGI